VPRKLFSEILNRNKKEGMEEKKGTMSGLFTGLEQGLGWVTQLYLKTGQYSNEGEKD